MLGLATSPPKLMKRIIAKEYVEMLPESCHLEAEAVPQLARGSTLGGGQPILVCGLSDGSSVISCLPLKDSPSVRLHANDSMCITKLRGNRLGALVPKQQTGLSPSQSGPDVVMQGAALLTYVTNTTAHT